MPRRKMSSGGVSGLMEGCSLSQKLTQDKRVSFANLLAQREGRLPLARLQLSYSAVMSETRLQVWQSQLHDMRKTSPLAFTTTNLSPFLGAKLFGRWSQSL